MAERTEYLSAQQFKRLGTASLQNEPSQGTLLGSWQAAIEVPKQFAIKRATVMSGARQTSAVGAPESVGGEGPLVPPELLQDIGKQVSLYVKMRLRRLDSALETVNEVASEDNRRPTEESVAFARQVAKSLFVWIFASNIQAEDFELSVGTRRDQGLYLVVDIPNEGKRVSFSIDKAAVKVRAALLVGDDIRESRWVTQASGTRPLLIDLITGK